MGLVSYTSPKGLDIEIDYIQNKVYTALGWASYNCYPRAYINQKNDKETTIEYAVNTKDYQEILFNDKVSASSFFVVTKSDKQDLRTEKATLALIFQVNLTSLKSTVTTRIADEDITNEIARILYKLPYGIKLLNIKKGVKDVYSDLGVNISNRVEMGKNFVCRFDLDVYYNTLNEPTTKTNQIIN